MRATYVHRTPGPSLVLMGAAVPIPCTTLRLCAVLQPGGFCGPVVSIIASTILARKIAENQALCSILTRASRA